MRLKRNEMPEIDPQRSVKVTNKALEKTNREYVPGSGNRVKNIRQYTKEMKQNLYDAILDDILKPYADDLTNHLARELKGTIKENIDKINTINKQKGKN